MPQPNDQPREFQSSIPSEDKPGTSATRKSVLLAAVMGLVLLVLAIAGYALISESGVPTEEEPPFFEQQLDSSTPPAPAENGVDLIPGNDANGSPEEVFCTMDAKICSDGSSVGRSGPNCEFDPCPGE